MRGFVFLKDSENIVKQINSMFEDSLHTYLTDYYENKEELIEKIKDRILRYVRKETKKQPIIIPNIIEKTIAREIIVVKNKLLDFVFMFSFFLLYLFFPFLCTTYKQILRLCYNGNNHHTS